LENTTEKANFSFAFNFEYNSSSKSLYENTTSFHIYLIKSDIIPHFDLLNNPAICCAAEGGSICDDFYYENDIKLKSDNLKVSNLLKDHAEFYKDYVLNEANGNFILKKFIEKKDDKYFYNNPYSKKSLIKQQENSQINSNFSDVVAYNNSSDYNSTSNHFIYDGKASNVSNITTDNSIDIAADRNRIDYGAIRSDKTLIVKEVRIKNKT